MPELLENSISGAEVHFVDFPGFGTEFDRNSPCTIKEIVEDMRTRWLTLKTEACVGQWSIVAISLGGMAALEWASRYPGDFQSAIVINSSARDFSPFYYRFRPGVLFKALRALLTRNAALRERFILEMTTNLQGDLENRAKEWSEFTRKSGFPISKILNQLLAGARYSIPQGIPIPVLVLASEKDNLVHPNCSRALAEHLSAELCVHSDAGHDLPIDAPLWLVDQIKKWAVKHHC